MTVSTAQTVGGTLAASVINSLTSSNASSTTANATLSGLVANLSGATQINTIQMIANQIIMTPNAGVAASIAEKIIADCQIADATLREIKLAGDISTLQHIITVQTHSTGLISGLLSNLGL